ncbi:MAG: SDR family oxidoreductase [Cyanobacteria bacterium J06635_1]
MPTIAITGSNRGIGLELCRQFLARGDDVIGICREATDAMTALGVEALTGIDVSDDGSVATLQNALGNRLIDVLINNAGIMGREKLPELDWEGIRRQFEINSLGPLRVTAALLDNLNRDAKIAIITSRMGSIVDNTSGGGYGYRMSKAAVNIAGVSLAHDLADRGVAVLMVHPGSVRTDLTASVMSAGQGIDVEESASGIIARIDELTVETTGRFIHAKGEPLPW